jgi:lambda family phage portal protein
MPFGFSIREALGIKGKAEPQVPAVTPRRRSYEGALISRLTQDWVAQGTSQDAEARGSMRILRNRVRQLVRDNDYAKQALRAIATNVVGTGIKFQSQVRAQRGGKLNTKVNQAIEQAWADWCRKDSCDVAGRLCFADIERLAVTSTAESGEILIRMIKQPFGRSKIPLGLEIIESDLLDDNYNGVGENGNEVRMGVEIDQWHRPVAYWFFQKHPGDFQYGQKGNPYQKRIRVPAEEVIHLYRADRPLQTRGIPWFASALTRLHHLSGYEQSEVIAARAGAALMGFVSSPEGQLLDEGVIDDQRVTEFSPGTIKYLAPGETFTVPSLQRPDTFEPFMRQMLRAVAAGLGVSYETVSRDFSQTNYSSSRLSLLEDRDNYRVLQDWLTENFHQVVFDAWLDLAVLSGELNLPGYDLDSARYNQARWIGRGWQWVDPYKEVQAYKEAVRCGFMTQADVIAQTGGDLEELLANRSSELQQSQGLGLVFDTDSGAVDAKGQEQPTPDNQFEPSDPSGDAPVVAPPKLTQPAKQPKSSS